MNRRRRCIGCATALLALATCWGALAQQQEDDWGDWDAWEETEAGWSWHGFLELGAGLRVQSNPLLGDTTLGEGRLRLETEQAAGAAVFEFKGDLYYDQVSGRFEADLRQLLLSRSVGRLDLKLGRQVLTWGSGDFVFLNDLFPKDFQAFFSGRDDEYLKAPSDALRAIWTLGGVNLDLVWAPEFEPDRYLTGERLSFFSSQAGALVAPDAGRVRAPNDFPHDGELALRAYKNLSGLELAAYGYRGFFKSPLGLAADGAFYPRLNVWGASLRRPLGSALVNAEVAYYDSREDPRGHKPTIPNSQWRLLLGYERELVSNLTLGLQAYLEHTGNHRELIANSPTPQFEPRRNRTLATARLTQRAFRERLITSLFLFHSPADEDYHLRARMDYRRDDRWTLSGGFNLFGGHSQATFFGQLDGNDNAYVRVRYGF